MDKIMKTKMFSRILPLAALLFIITSCWPDMDDQPVGDNPPTDSQEVKEEMNEYSTARRDAVELQVHDLVRTLRERVNELERWDQTANITSEARLKNKQLRDDLMKLREELENSLDSLENTAEGTGQKMTEEMQNKLELAKEKLEKLRAQTEEWQDENLN